MDAKAILLLLCISNSIALTDNNFIESLNLQVSRTSGVAPLGVFFDATDIASSSTDKPFHELDFAWEFGDQDSGYWTNGKSKNFAKGAVTAHVFEEPGTYTVTLTLRDMNSNTATEEIRINVLTEPAGGWQTYCIANSDNFDSPECSSAEHIVTSTFDINSYLGQNARILFKRGDQFLATQGTLLRNIQGPGIIGAFGNCINPNARGICENSPIITGTMSEDTPFLTLWNLEDWRIMDLHFIGYGISGGVTDMKKILHLRLQNEDANVALGNSHWEMLGHDNWMLVDSELRNSTSNVVYVGSEKLVLMGNLLDTAKESHVLRVWQAYKGVISNNIITTASIENDAGRHALKMHGPAESLISTDETESHLQHRTKFVIISDNIFGGSGPWPVAIGPQDAINDERLSNIVFERNQLLSGFGSTVREIQQHMVIWASNITIRNNIFDGSSSLSSYRGIGIGQRGVELPASGISVYNNVIFTSSQIRNELDFLAADTTDITFVANNIFYAPNDDNSVFEPSGTISLQANLFQQNPEFMENFRISDTSPAVDAGVLVPIFDDFFGNERPQGTAIDIGIYETGACNNMTLSELISHINRWRDGLMTIEQIMSSISNWKNGC